MLDRVAQTVARYGMFEPGQRVGAAVSGGADSICLLHVLRELAPRWNLSLRVLHLDHQIRGAESRADAEFVREIADRLNLPYEEARADMGSGNLEQEARAARRAFFRRVLQEGRADCIALGHTRSDQAETVLFRFLRGAGSAGLAGIRPVLPIGFVRPLIEVERADVLQFLNERGLTWREDSSNRNRRFARNRIRHDLLPALIREWNPGLVRTLAHTAGWAAAEEDYWERQIQAVAARMVIPRGPAMLFRASGLRQMHTAAARRFVRHLFGLVKGDLRGLDFEHVEQVLALAAHARGEGCVQVPGVEVLRSFDWVRMSPPGYRDAPFRLPLPVPGRVSLPNGVLTTELTENMDATSASDCRYNRTMSRLDWSRIASPWLEVRGWNPGDQYRPVAHAGEEKFKVLFQRAKVPLWERRIWPVIVRGEEIVWSRKFGPAARFAADSGSAPVLIVRDEWFQESARAE